ncbi:MAG: hypothetical protein EOO68_15765 [Moraxellaceae bacterium]|nr:MAG: hypothetical protein EOO68_15765 [Moraxellaceae bacterium]
MFIGAGQRQDRTAAIMEIAVIIIFHNCKLTFFGEFQQVHTSLRAKRYLGGLVAMRNNKQHPDLLFFTQRFSSIQIDPELVDRHWRDLRTSLHENFIGYYCIPGRR